MQSFAPWIWGQNLILQPLLLDEKWVKFFTPRFLAHIVVAYPLLLAKIYVKFYWLAFGSTFQGISFPFGRNLYILLIWFFLKI